ncbi:hypothetical protein CALCODRAFT_375674 [Calocera cornea HHB12733]|uniref:Uncharacterized protein n=1 Tax=Calocera cornea HHB12733 TaxID=1353952 RepID=A0A165EFA1_9BASI|nr:hypothetical protein CALCODRAFT_375674 [Calocera cornea HHB12733]
MSYPPNSYTHPHPHPYATASRASPRPPPSASASASQLQPSNSQRRRSTSLPYHSHAPLGPPTAPPRIPLPDVPRESLGLDDWPPRPPLALSPTSTSTSPTSPGRPQLLGPGIPAAPPITQSRSLPGTAAPEGRFPTLQEDDEEPPQRACDRDRVRRSTDSGASSELSAHSYLSGGAGSRPGSRASGRITPLPSGVMRRYSATGARSAGPTAPGTAVGAGGQGQSSRSKSRSRATSDGDGYASASAYGSPLLPSIALDPPTLEERERLRLLERERERSSSRTPGRARQMVGALIGSLNAHAYSSSNPPPALALAPSGGGAAAKAPGPPSPTKPMRTSPSLPQIPQHAPLTTPGGSEDWHASDPPTVRRKMSAPRVDTSGAVLGRDASLHRRSSVGLLGLSGRDVAIMAPGVVEESHGRARSNSKATVRAPSLLCCACLCLHTDTDGQCPTVIWQGHPGLSDQAPAGPLPARALAQRRLGRAPVPYRRVRRPPVRQDDVHTARAGRVAAYQARDGCDRAGGGAALYAFACPHAVILVLMGDDASADQLRSSKIPVAPTEPGQQAPVVHYRILEVDSKQVDWEMDTPAWPPWMPHVDGAFVLFDSTNRRNAYVAPAVGASCGAM